MLDTHTNTHRLTPKHKQTNKEDIMYELIYLKKTVRFLFEGLFQSVSNTGRASNMWNHTEKRKTICSTSNWNEQDNCKLGKLDNSKTYKAFWSTVLFQAKYLVPVNFGYDCEANFLQRGIAWMEMSGWQNVMCQIRNMTTWFMKAHHSVQRQSMQATVKAKLTCRQWI